jgi:hypothetical protein
MFLNVLKQFRLLFSRVPALQLGSQGPQVPRKIVARRPRFGRGLQTPDLPTYEQQRRSQLDSIGGPAGGGGI